MLQSRDLALLLIAAAAGFLLFRRVATPGTAPKASGASLWMLPGDVATGQSMAPVSDLRRGERNNNPGNIRHGASRWQGMSASQPDSAFVTFDTPEAGIRALAVLLKNYAKQGFQTIATIIGKYAPSNENDTFAYARAVSAAMGVPTNQILNLNDPATLQALVTAIIKHENGRVIYSAAQIGTGVMSA